MKHRYTVTPLSIQHRSNYLVAWEYRDADDLVALHRLQLHALFALVFFVPWRTGAAVTSRDLLEFGPGQMNRLHQH